MTGIRFLRTSLFVLLLCLIGQKGKSQEIGFSFLSYPSVGYNLVFEPGMNGAGASIFFNRNKYRKLNLSLSGEYAMTTWGHQAFMGLGINRTWVSWERFEFNTYFHFLNGLAFYRPNPLYVFGFDTRAAANYYLYQDIKLFLGFGIRYTLAPGYSNYGLIETSFDLPLELGMKFLMGRR